MAKQPAYIIAEIGTSHQGNTDLLEKLIQSAAEAGANCAKFQWVYAEEILHPATGTVPLPTGNISLYQRFSELECLPAFYAQAQLLCKKFKLDFLCTPFGLRSARELYQLNVSAFKIASPELNHLPLVELLANSGKKLIISSGVSTLADIDEAFRTIEAARQGKVPSLDALGESPFLNNQAVSDRSDFALLHCITSYPAPEEQFNLRLIANLSAIFGVVTGISDHSLDPVLVPALTMMLGGAIIEKHFCLSNETDGLDDPIALNPADFKRMVDSVRQVEQCIADEILPISPIAMQSVLQKIEIPINLSRIERILGDGIKRLAPSELANYGRTNRSIHARRTITAGEIFTADNIVIVRTEKVLRPGLHPRYLPHIIGKTVKRTIDDGQGIDWKDI